MNELLGKLFSGEMTSIYTKSKSPKRVWETKLPVPSFFLHLWHFDQKNDNFFKERDFQHYVPFSPISFAIIVIPPNFPSHTNTTQKRNGLKIEESYFFLMDSSWKCEVESKEAFGFVYFLRTKTTNARKKKLYWKGYWKREKGQVTSFPVLVLSHF